MASNTAARLDPPELPIRTACFAATKHGKIRECGVSTEFYEASSLPQAAQTNRNCPD
jgi:hypothetical protein